MQVLIFFGSPIYLGTILYPLTYIITCKVIKKTSVRNAISLMAISLISLALMFVISWAILNNFDSSLMVTAFMSFFTNQLIIIVMYDFLVSIKQDSYGMLFLVLLLVNIIDTVIFGKLVEGNIISLSILIRLVYIVAVPALIAKKTIKSNK